MHAYRINVHRITPNMHKMVLLQMVPHICLLPLPNFCASSIISFVTLYEPIIDFAPTIADSGCGGNRFLRNRTGILSTPDHPNKYERNLNCRWTIEASRGDVVLMSLMDLNMENPMQVMLCLVSAKFVSLYHTGPLARQSQPRM